MNRDDVLRLAQEAGIVWSDHTVVGSEENLLERFAALVAAHERDACAKVCEQMSGPIETYNTAYEHYIKCAEAIRARG